MSLFKVFKINCRCLLLLIITACFAACITPTGPHSLQKAIDMEVTEPSESIKVFTKIIQDNPGTILAQEAHYRLGILFLKNNRLTDAQENFRILSGYEQKSIWTIAGQVEYIKITVQEPQKLFQEIHNISIEMNNYAVIPDLIKVNTFSILADLAWELEQYPQVIDAVNSLNLLQLPSDQEYHFTLIQGLAYMKLDQNIESLASLRRAFNSPDSDKILILPKLMSLFAQTKQPLEAVDLAMKHPLLFMEKEVRIEFASILSNSITDEEILNLEETYTSGFGALLIRFEKVDRLVRQGDLKGAFNLLDNLERSWPRYHGDINLKRREIKDITNVSVEKIGLMVPLSGNLASLGHSIYRGAQLAIQDYKTNGGEIPFHLVVKDTANTDTEISDNFQELSQEEKVIAVVGPVKSNHVHQVLSLSAELMTPLLTPGCPDDEIIYNSDWAFRLYPSNINEMTELIRFSVRDLNITRFGCLYPDINYGNSAVSKLKKTIDNEKAELVFIKSYSPDLSNIKSIIKTISEHNVDALIIPDNAERASVVSGQIRYQENLLPTILGLGAWDHEKLLEVAGNNLNGSFYITTYPVSHGIRKEISDRYRVTFGESPDLFSLRSYEAVYIIISAIEQGVNYRSQLLNYLNNQNGVWGLDGKTIFSESGDYLPQSTIYLIDGNYIKPWRIITTHQPSETDDCLPDQTPVMESPPIQSTDQVILPQD